MAFNEGVLVADNGIINPTVVLERTQPMLTAFDVTADPFAEPKVFGEQLNRCDPRYQGDDRIPLLRQTLEGSKRYYAPEAIELIMDAADALEMREPESPLSGDYEEVLAIGAARRAVYDRLAYGANAVAGDETRPPLASVSGGLHAAVTSRPLGGGKFWAAHEEVVAAGLVGKDMAYNADKWPIEASLGNGAVRLAKSDHPELAEQLDVIHFDDPDVPAGLVLGHALEVLQVPMGARVAAIVQQIYRISLGLDMQRVSKAHGAMVDVAGCPSDPRVVANRTPDTYLAEVLKAIRAAQSSLL